MKAILRNIVFALALAALAACSKDGDFGIDGGYSYRTGPDETAAPAPKSRRVLLVYSAGFNSLSADLEDDISELMEGEIPARNSGSVILVFSKRTFDNRSDYSVKTPAHLLRIYKNSAGKIVSDTLRTWPEGTVAASASTLNEVLSYVGTTFPSSDLGMIFSSHASGWVPKGYYSTGTITQYASGTQMVSGMLPAPERPVQSFEDALDGLRVRSIGMDMINSRTAYEMNIEDFASAIPMKLNYIIMDACLMGGVEVAYALRDKTRYLVFSQTEVLADGLCDYSTIAARLFKAGGADLSGLCTDSYSHYSALSGLEQSVTISLVGTDGLGRLSEVCAQIFDKYREEIGSVSMYNVQKYYRYSKQWYFDIEDILVKAGVQDDDLAEFRDALSSCVLYKAATPRFLSIDIDTFSGLSMYLPCADSNSALRDFYRGLSWNVATGLVK
ncbi:MAG: clostripain-related cysteine peptidase [Candidatus Cryptobacteroides sp.]